MCWNLDKNQNCRTLELTCWGIWFELDFVSIDDVIKGRPSWSGFEFFWWRKNWFFADFAQVVSTLVVFVVFVGERPKNVKRSLKKAMKYCDDHFLTSLCFNKKYTFQFPEKTFFHFKTDRCKPNINSKKSFLTFF